MTLNLAETSVAKSRLLVPYGADLFAVCGLRVFFKSVILFEECDLLFMKRLWIKLNVCWCLVIMLESVSCRV